MRALILPIALLAAAPALAAPPQARPACDRPQLFATHGRERVELKRLDQLPRAKQYLTVFREIDRCPAPIIVRDDIGAVPHR